MDETGFWSGFGNALKSAGREVLLRALLLYFAFRSPRTPAWAKAVIAGALSYFVSPIDAIPDAIPFIGYTDDFAVMGGALATIAVYVDDEVRAQAEAVLRNWGVA